MFHALRRHAALLLISSAALVLDFASSAEYAPIENLNTTAYLGRWYQTHSSFQFVLLTFGGQCVTADYELVDDKKISLVNQGRPLLVPRFLVRTTGFAVQSPEGQPEGAFTVAQRYLLGVDSDSVVFEDPGNYWIFAIGPLDENDQYQWAAVSNPQKTLSFIITRNIQEFQEKYQDEVLALFDELGFNRFFVNKPIKTRHLLCFGAGY